MAREVKPAWAGGCISGEKWYSGGMIRMVALDLDDTLLRSDLSMSFWTRNVIKKVIAKGIAVVLATGRTPESLKPFARKLGLYKQNAFIICENGSLVIESMTGNTLLDITVPQKAALTVYKLADAEGFAIQKYDGDTIYLSRKNEFTEYDKKLTGLKQVVVENFRALVEEGCRKLLIPGDPMILKPMEGILKAYVGDEVTIFTSKPYFLEILPPNIDKGTSLALIAEKLTIRREEVMAIGDSMNDEAMIRWAGYGVAMINGDDRIKSIARMITEKTNNDDGVAHTLSRYILKDEPLP
jgi:Cof subfamily protein (haloacid dehalogenase superfamily)